MVAATSG